MGGTGFCYDSSMVFLASAVLFVFGTIIASFVGVVAGRLNTGQGFLVGRSRCDACDAPLSPYSIVPIISYALFGGRARCCGVLLSASSPITELLLGTLFVLSYLKLGFTPVLPILLISLSALLALVLYDLAHQILPPLPLAIFVAASIVTGFFLAQSFSAFSSSLITPLLIAVSLSLIHFLSHGRAMGFADAPLSFGLAVLSGPAALPGFIFSFWIGAAIGIVLLARRPSGSRMGVEVPFAPFLAAGFLLAFFTQWNPFIFIEDLL